jgi:hypothetical protein
VGVENPVAGGLVDLPPLAAALNSRMLGDQPLAVISTRVKGS